MRYAIVLMALALVADQAGAQNCPGGYCGPGVNVNFPQAGWPGQFSSQPPIVYGVPGGYAQPAYSYGAPSWSPQPFTFQAGGSCFGSSFAPQNYGYGGFQYSAPFYPGRAVFGSDYGYPDYRSR